MWQRMGRGGMERGVKGGGEEWVREWVREQLVVGGIMGGSSSRGFMLVANMDAMRH